MAESIPLDELLALVEAHGLTAEPQAAFFKVQSGRRIMHIARPRSGQVRRVDLKGCDDLQHAAFRQLTRDEAAAQHLGRVSMQIDFERADAAREAFEMVLNAMAPLHAGAARNRGGPRPHTTGLAPVPPVATTPITLRLSAELAAALEDEQKVIQAQTPPGLEVTLASTIRVLLHEATDARRRARAASTQTRS